LKERGRPVYAITNFAVEKLDLTRHRHDFLNLFDGIVVSGAVVSGWSSPTRRSTAACSTITG
jgi:FMN phosphatase YigB (HAD superfamily)